MRQHRLLIANEAGSATVTALPAILLLLILALGVVQVAMTLYARNVVLSAAHEGARAAAELGRDAGDASAIAHRTVERSAGGVIDGLEVAAQVQTRGGVRLVAVHLDGRLRSLGPIPVSLPISAEARVSAPAAAG